MEYIPSFCFKCELLTSLCQCWSLFMHIYCSMRKYFLLSKTSPKILASIISFTHEELSSWKARLSLLRFSTLLPHSIGNNCKVFSIAWLPSKQPLNRNFWQKKLKSAPFETILLQQVKYLIKIFLNIIYYVNCQGNKIY